MRSFSETQCPHCQKVIPYHLLKRAPLERKFLPPSGPPELFCPRCGGSVKNTMNRSGFGSIPLIVIAAIPVLHLAKVKIHTAIVGIAILIAFVSLFISVKNNKLTKEE